jgi:hypothetical protein
MTWNILVLKRFKLLKVGLFKTEFGLDHKIQGAFKLKHD